MENHHFYTWPFSIAMLNYQRVSAVSSSSHLPPPSADNDGAVFASERQELGPFPHKALRTFGGERRGGWADGKKAIPVEFVWVQNL
jgi:hypothetical protein